jgi:hypothetical protein
MKAYIIKGDIEDTNYELINHVYPTIDEALIAQKRYGDKLLAQDPNVGEQWRYAAEIQNSTSNIRYDFMGYLIYEIEIPENTIGHDKANDTITFQMTVTRSDVKRIVEQEFADLIFSADDQERDEYLNHKYTEDDLLNAGLYEFITRVGGNFDSYFKDELRSLMETEEVTLRDLIDRYDEDRTPR